MWRPGFLFTSKKCLKSVSASYTLGGTNFYLGPLSFTWILLSIPALSFILSSSQACLGFTLHQFQIPSFCNSEGDLYFLTWSWQTQGWLCWTTTKFSIFLFLSSHHLSKNIEQVVLLSYFLYLWKNILAL